MGTESRGTLPSTSTSTGIAWRRSRSPRTVPRRISSRELDLGHAHVAGRTGDDIAAAVRYALGVAGPAAPSRPDPREWAVALSAALAGVGIAV